MTLPPESGDDRDLVKGTHDDMVGLVWWVLCVCVRRGEEMVILSNDHIHYSAVSTDLTFV
jgi:hypothetical protein